MPDLKDIAGKTVLFGVSGGIAAYKAVDAVSRLRKMGAEVLVVMTANAARLVAPITFQSISHNPVYVDMFASPQRWSVEHVALADQADILAVAPATANVMAKLAHGLADDFLTTVSLAFGGPKLLFPAMNRGMWENPVTQQNVQHLRRLGWDIVGPTHGRLACGQEGTGRLLEPYQIAARMADRLAFPPVLSGRRVLVTAGPTREYLDAFRFLSNPSTGKMGYALARVAHSAGARVRLVSGPSILPPPWGVETSHVVSAQEMLETCRQLWPVSDVVIMAAAVADYAPHERSAGKIKKEDHEGLSTKFCRTTDILRTLADTPGPRLRIGFAAEVENARANARAKLESKKLHLIVLNRIDDPDSGFASDTNRVALISPDGEQDLPLLSKDEVARRIIAWAGRALLEHD